MLRPRTPFETFIRHPLEAAVALVFWLSFRVLPMATASHVGGWLARKIGPSLAASNRARRNIRRAMPEKSEAEVEEIVRGMWENLGRTIGEFPHVARMQIDGPDGQIVVRGVEHVAAFKESGKGGLFFSGHLANWELTPMSAIAHGLDATFVYREANNPLVEKLFFSERRSRGANLLKKGSESAKGVIRALAQKGYVGMLVDQKMNDGIAVPFFGIDAMTAPALGTLALRFDCPVLPARVIRKDGVRFEVEVLPVMRPEKSDDRDADVQRFMTRVNAVLEAWIREHPDQWLWLHNRWPAPDI